MGEDHVLTLDTSLDTHDLTQELRKYEPWGHRIDFSNGVSTAQFERRVPFNENLLLKFHTAAKHIPFEHLRGGALLDIGCNSGHNSIYAAQEYGMEPVGIDVSPRHMQAAGFIAGLAGIQAEFLLANAETFSRPATFDVVLHFGTLYHLPNPLLSLQTTFDNLKPGGYIALETQSYDDPEHPHLCAFMHMFNNDCTNFWVISEHVLRQYMTFIGFRDIVTAIKSKPKMLPDHQYRVMLVARRPA